MGVRLQRSSGNVFRDLGFSAGKSESLTVRSNLMIQVAEIIRARGLSRARAARLFGVTQPRISNLIRGKIGLFTIDSLIEMLGRAGARVLIRVTPGRRVA